MVVQDQNANDPTRALASATMVCIRCSKVEDTYACRLAVSHATHL